jgi:hypothetical protein
MRRCSGGTWRRSFLVVDVLTTASHLLEHNWAALYIRSHKMHHRFTNPKLYNAFSGSLLDTFSLILVPLFLTHQICFFVNNMGLAAFGTLYAAQFTMIHCEYRHPWDTLFEWLGIGTAEDHNIHHLLFKYNYGHFFMWWDWMLGTYKAPHTVKQFRSFVELAGPLIPSCSSNCRQKQSPRQTQIEQEESRVKFDSLSLASAMSWLKRTVWSSGHTDPFALTASPGVAPQTSASVLQDGSLSPRQQQSHTLNASSPFSTLSVSHSSASTSASLASSSSNSNNSNSNSNSSSSSLDELVRFIELHDDAAVRRHLKKHPAHVNDPLDAAGRTPLMLAAGAALHTDTAVLRTLLRCDRVVVNARDAAGNTALHHLVRHGARGALFADALEAFAQHRADFSARNAYHETLLHAAVSNAVAPVAVRCVLEREAVDLAVRTMPDGLTALHYALQQQNLYAVELLLEWGAAVERAPRDMTLLAAAFPPPATTRVVALLRMHEGWQERMSVAQHQFVAFYHTQRLPDPWTAVPEAWSTLPERDALIIKIVNSEIAHAHDIALFGRRYAPVLQRLLSAVEARDILSSLPLVHVVTRRLASLLASTKYEIGEVFNGLFSDISVSYENICAAQDRIKAKLRHMCQSNKELADALEKKAVDSHGAADTSHSLFSMLNVPLLRLFEHKKLLTQLLEWTPTLMADHAHLTLAVQSYEELFKRINEKNRRFGRVALARNLTVSFDVPLSPESEMTCAGPVRLLVGRHWRAANAYLCSDRLFLCDSSSKKAKLVAAPDVHGLRVHEHAPDAPLPEKESPRRAFVVESALGATFVLAALADDDKPHEKTGRAHAQAVALCAAPLQRAMRQQLSRVAPRRRRPSIGGGHHCGRRHCRQRRRRRRNHVR